MSLQVQSHASAKTVICGVSGTGKSTLFEKLLRRERAKYWFLYDHKQGDMSRRFGVRPCYTQHDLKAAVLRGGLIIFDPSKLFPGKPEKGFAVFCKWFWQVAQHLPGKKIFGCDELDALVDVYSKPAELCVILDQGRTFQIDCYFICHAMNAIHNGVRKQLTEIFVFRQGDRTGADYLEKNKGFPAAMSLNLPNGKWLYKNTNTGESRSGGSAFQPPASSRDLRGL